MKTYHNKVWGFTIMLPDGWREPSWLVRLFKYRKQNNLVFIGPFHSSLEFAIGPIYPVPEVSEQQNNLESMALSYGHQVMDIGVIQADGKDHAWMLFRTSKFGEIKTYSLIFGRTEFLITSKGRFQETDAIVRSFRLSKRP